MTQAIKQKKYDFNGLARADVSELEQLIVQGHLPDFEQIAGWEFKGYNRPEFTKYLGIRKFVKGFYIDESDHPGGYCGYNVQVIQTPLEGPWNKKRKKGKPAVHGFYHVLPVKTESLDNLYPNSYLLDYGRSAKNPAFDPSRGLRDYLVQVYEDNPDLLLGKAYFALSRTRIEVSYFILERLEKGEYP